MSRFRLKRPNAALVSPKGAMSIAGDLRVQYVKSLGSVLLNGIGRSTVQGGLAPTFPPAPSGWVIPNLTFEEGQTNQSFDLKTTLPSGVIAGGTFDVEGSLSPTPPSPPTPTGRILTVGTGKQYALPSQAAAVAQSGDTIQIDAGDYVGDVCSWYASDITIVGMNGRAKIFANGNDELGKGIWVINGANTTIYNVEFHDATVPAPDSNGAGIRLQAGGLHCINCGFYDCENGVLTDNDPTWTVTFEYCEFARNGFGDGYTHAMYMGQIGVLNVKYCYSHETKIGHALKSRARENYIEYSYFMDGDNGTSSYLLNFDNGGKSVVRGCLLQKGPLCDNGTAVFKNTNTWGASYDSLTLEHNTFVSTNPGGVFVAVNSGTVAAVANIFAGTGTGTFSGGTVTEVSNLTTDASSFPNATNLTTPDFWPSATFEAQLPLAGDTTLLPYDVPRPFVQRAAATQRKCGALQAKMTLNALEAAGMTLSSDGVLKCGTATQQTLTGIVFGYNEPVSGGGGGGGTAASVLTLHPTASGTSVPYMASYFPLEGAVPSGQTLTSPDDTTMRCAVLSRWEDASAKVVVIHGTTTVDAGVPKQINLQVNPDTSGTSLTPARVGQLITNVTVNYQGTNYQLTNFGSPARVWWANERCICARYNLKLTRAMVALIDIHAFSVNSAKVEVQIENSLLDTTANPVPTPATETFTGLTVSVNGTQIGAPVDSPVVNVTVLKGAKMWNHSGMDGMRAFYKSTWVGTTGITEVTHSKDYIESHPIFWKNWRAANFDLQNAYQNDTYSIWNSGRQCAVSMGDSASQEWIGLVPVWESDYIRSGDRYARRAVVENAKALLHFTINFRNQTTCAVTNQNDSEGKRYADGTWPGIDGAHGETASDPAFETAHFPDGGLTAFLCQPSPMFIELAQKIGNWITSRFHTGGVLHKPYQARGRAWGLRSLANAIFLSPDGDPYKAAAQAVFVKNVNYQETYRTRQAADHKLYLGVPNYEYYPPGQEVGYECRDFEGGYVGMQSAIWWSHWYIVSMHRAAGAKVLTGAEQTKLEGHADWAAEMPIRQITECSAGQWRFTPYYLPIGRYNGTTDTGDLLFDSLPTWGEMYDWYYNINGPAPESGSGFFSTQWKTRDVSTAFGVGAVYDQGGDNYASHFCAAVAVGVERGVPNCDAAWSRLTNNISTSFFDAFGTDGRWGFYPRNK